MFRFFRSKRPSVRLVRIPGTQYYARTGNTIPLTINNTNPTPVTGFGSTPVSTSSCGCNHTSNYKQECPSSGVASKRNTRQVLRDGGNFMDNIPQYNDFVIQLDNTTGTAKDVILFDARGESQDEMGIPSFPIGVNLTALTKSYQNFLDGLGTRNTFYISKIELSLISGVETQIDNKMFFYAANDLRDDTHRIGEADPSGTIDKQNARRLSYATVCVNQMLNDSFGILYRLEANTSIRLKFIFSAKQGGDR